MARVAGERGGRGGAVVAGVVAAAWMGMAGSPAAQDRSPASSPVSGEQARRVHQRAIVVDTHADTLWRILDEGDDISVRSAKGHLDVPRMIEGGVDAQFFAIWVQPSYGPDGAARRALRLIDAFHAMVARNADRMVFAQSPADIRAAAAAGKVAALMGIEGGQAIENDLGLLRMYHRLGVRYMTLTWSYSLDWADSSGDKGRWGGLNDFGVKVVEEMNRLGMLVDVSHASDETFFDVMKASSAPVIASHSSCRALCDAPRNMTDDMLRAVKANGGVVMINFYSAFLDQAFRDASKKAEKELEQKKSAIGARYLHEPAGLEAALWQLHLEADASVPPPPLARIIDHIEHVIRVAGVDHVGLGSDFDGVTSLPRGMEDVSKLPAITRALLERGHSEQDVEKILGGNFLRVFDDVVRRSKSGS
ncbi:MAG TPA: dipeptidase [Candidatus Polarisedimenticolia bacterium]|nr:dipeptidase [Candidatus Polarisedimenticolia bacterium]